VKPVFSWDIAQGTLYGTMIQGGTYGFGTGFEIKFMLATVEFRHPDSFVRAAELI
jgi:hypothetical protein